MLLALMIAAATASPGALRLGRELAESGTLASLPMIQKEESEELVAAHPELGIKKDVSAAYCKETGKLCQP